MPYGIRYQADFYTRSGGGPWHIEIRLKSLDNDLTKEMIEMPENPIVHQYPTVGRYEPIMGSGLTFQIWNTVAQGQLYFQDLFTSGEYEVQVRLTIGDVTPSILFKGYIVPSMYSDVYQPRPRAISVACTDSLSMLKHQHFHAGGVTDEFFLIDLIVEALKLTGLDLDIYIFMNISHGVKNPDDAPFLNGFTETMFNEAGLLDGNGDVNSAYSILYNILKPFGCVLKQARLGINAPTVWVIDRYRYMNEDRTFDVYDFNGGLKGTYSYVVALETVLETLPVLDTAPALNYKSGYKTATIDTLRKKFSNLISPGLAASPTGINTEFFYDSGTQVTPLIRKWYSASFGYTVVSGGVRPDHLFTLNDATDLVTINPLDFSIDGVETATKFSLSDDYANELISIAITIDFTQSDLLIMIGQTNQAAKNVFCLIEVEVQNQGGGEHGRLIKHDPANGDIDGITRLVDPDPVVANTQVRTVVEKLFDGDDDPQLQEIFRQTFLFEYKGSVLSEGDFYMEIRLCPCMRSTPFNDDVDLAGSEQLGGAQFISQFEVAVSEVVQKNILESEINSDFVERYNDNIQFGDVINLNYTNGFLRPNEAAGAPIPGTGLPTFIWQENWEGTALPLLERWITDIFQTFHLPRFQLVLDVRLSQTSVDVMHIIREVAVTNKRYWISGYEHNLRWEVLKLTLEEFVKDDGVVPSV